MPSSKSKSKCKDKLIAKASKEQRKASSKTSITTTAANGYNPILGTFHTIETSQISTSPPFPESGRFHTIGETDEHSSSPQGTTSEYDSVSNNRSCSGESEDPKEKISNSSPRHETIPGTDNDRREKIRLKNERKHQRQRERRAQELHERCYSYLMSRKLDMLSQGLVAMGFSPERATQALMLNEGKVEESVSWLFEGSEGAQSTNTTNFVNGGNLRIDVSEELGRISEIEAIYKCSKQEVERAVVACEGDLEKAEESIRARKQVQPTVSQSESESKNTITTRETPSSLPRGHNQRNHRDPNSTNASDMGSTLVDIGNWNLQSLKMNQPKSLSENRWSNTGSRPSTITPTPLEQGGPSQEKAETRLFGVVGYEGRNSQRSVVREPIIVMQQHPQYIDAKQKPVSSAFPLGTTEWYSNNIPAALQNSKSNGNLEQFYHQSPYQELAYMIGPMDSPSIGMEGSWSTVSTSSPSLVVPFESQRSWGKIGTSSSPLIVPSSLGLFSGVGSVGKFSTLPQVDWNTGGMMADFDYTSIDWTLDYPSSKSSGLWLGLSSLLRNSSATRLPQQGMQNGRVAMESVPSTSLREWTTPFEGKDIFSAPRRFVTSPSL